MTINEIVKELCDIKNRVDSIADEMYQNNIYVDSQVEAIDNLKSKIRHSILELTQ